MNDVEGKLGRRWWLFLPLALLVVFPIGLLTLGELRWSVALQPVYTWMMSIGLMGLFRATMHRPSSGFRYLSDASYWIVPDPSATGDRLQAVVRDWMVLPIVKLLLINAISILILVLTYHFLVRYTWIGHVLNGNRQRSMSAGRHPEPT